MHPQSGHRNQNKQQHERRGPDPSGVQQDTKCDWQDETAQPTDHSHKAADRSNVIWVIVWDVLIDRGLTKAHHKTQDNAESDKQAKGYADIKFNGAIDPLHDVVATGIGHQKQYHKRHRKGHVSDKAGAPFIRHPTPYSAKY